MAWWDGGSTGPVSNSGIPYRMEYGGFGGNGLDVTGQLLQQGQNPLLMDFNQLGALGKIGAVSQGLGAFSSLANLYAGFKALNLQEKQFKFARDAWNKNYANQVKDYENTLKDRWAARDASARSRGGTYSSMASWVGERALTGG